MLASVLGELLWWVTVLCRRGQRALGYRRYDSRVAMPWDLREL